MVLEQGYAGIWVFRQFGHTAKDSICLCKELVVGVEWQPAVA